jgi:hypothetical protein
MARAALGALSYWWLAFAELLTGRRLLFGVPAAVGPRGAWQNSLSGAFTHALAPMWTDGRLASAALWAAAAVVLPWLVRGSRVQLRALGALVWAVLLVAAGALLASHLGLPRPPSPLLAGSLAGVLALASAGVGLHAHRSPNVA